MEGLLRVTIQDLVAYDPKEPNGGIKLDANEMSYPVPAKLREHMAKWVMTASFNRYPNTNSDVLREAIADTYDVSPKQVICGVGSDQLIDNLFMTYVEKGDSVIIPEPSFSMYSLVAKMYEADLIKVELDKAFNYNKEAYLESIREADAKLIFICTPNNPTGTIMSLDMIEEIVGNTKGIVVVDEAYIEFGGESAIGLVSKYENIIVLRTFSKAYGLAGARVGYGITNEKMIEHINRVNPPYNLNCFSQEIAKWVILNKEIYQPLIDKTVKARAYVANQLIELGVKVYPSGANFLWVETALPLREILSQEEVYIRQMSYNNQVYYRITIGTPQENERLLDVLRKRGEGNETV